MVRCDGRLREGFVVYEEMLCSILAGWLAGCQGHLRDDVLMDRGSESGEVYRPPCCLLPAALSFDLAVCHRLIYTGSLSPGAESAVQRGFLSESVTFLAIPTMNR